MKGVQFSIIIPTYNASKTLASCLDSLVSQTLPAFEILIIDGGSVDNTLKIITNYVSLHANIQVVSEKDEGIYDAMNKGIVRARGEWIYFLGSDDQLFNKEVLKKVGDNIDEQDDIVYGDSIWLPENVTEGGEWSHYRLLNSSINHQRIFYSASKLKKSGSFNLRYKISADYELNIRLFCNAGLRKKYLETIIAFYHSGGYSAGKIDEDFWDDWKIIFLKNFSRHLPQKDIYKRVSWYCWYAIGQEKYAKAASLFHIIFFQTLSVTFLRHSISQVLKSLRKYNRIRRVNQRCAKQ